MTQQQNSEKQKKINIEASIQVSLNGLSFCLLDRSLNKIFHYRKINFRKKLTPADVLQQIKLVYAKDSKLQQKADKLTLIFANDLYTLLPHIFFNEENASDYLKFNTKILQTDFVSHDIISKPQIVNTYIPFTNISNYFFDLYGEFDYKHSITIFLEALSEIKSNSETTFYINNNERSFDLAVFENGKLLLCNTFFYETKEDFIYYVLFTAEQLKKDPNKFQLIFMGEIEKESELYRMVYIYIRNVDFFTDDFKFKVETEEKPMHLRNEFILLKSFDHENSFRNS
ncbi:MAG TPA: DUF3822 family protein [Salinimicrobium sp.]|nr:DUF3822 family protein [Salinimicrobium sp.]